MLAGDEEGEHIIYTTLKICLQIVPWELHNIVLLIFFPYLQISGNHGMLNETYTIFSNSV